MQHGMPCAGGSRHRMREGGESWRLPPAPSAHDAPLLITPRPRPPGALHLQDDAVAGGVVAAPPRAARHLEELVVGERRDAAVAAARERRHEGRARGHVDAGSQGLRRKDELEQASLEEALDQRLPGGQAAGVVAGHAPQQGPHELLLHSLGLLSAQRGDLGADRGALLRRRQRHVRGREVLRAQVALAAAEDEPDGGQHAGARERRGDALQRGDAAPARLAVEVVGLAVAAAGAALQQLLQAPHAVRRGRRRGRRGGAGQPQQPAGGPAGTRPQSCQG